MAVECSTPWQGGKNQEEIGKRFAQPCITEIERWFEGVVRALGSAARSTAGMGADYLPCSPGPERSCHQHGRNLNGGPWFVRPRHQSWQTELVM